ncbi:MAG: lysophospholipid acyltransferase family protein [Candidatus Omnitrophica bacterium]|nr:lysophospholipid acyltransferase family protein [Candidatus Omnitrophota bacterium]
MKNRLRRKILYRLTLFIRFLLRKLPSSWGIALGAFLGRSAFWVLGKERRKTVQHLTLAFGKEKTPHEIFKVGESVFQNLGKTVAELIYFPKITQKTLNRWVSFEGLSKLDTVLQSGKGGVLLVAHFGNWELLARALSLKGYQGIIVIRKVYDERFDRLLSEIRQSEGLKYLYRDESPKQMLRILHQNQFLGILADQDIDSVDGIFVPFFGKEAYTPVAPARFAIASGAPVIPCFMIREGNGRHRLVVEEPLWPANGSDKEEAVNRLTERWMSVTESYIRRFPDQWVWMHRRWKTRPEKVMTNDKIQSTK